MGTQQILMIVLSVIVVGAAVAVGIMMFDNQSRNQTRAAVLTDLLNFGINTQAYYRTPVLMGGAGNNTANLGENFFFFINDGTVENPILTPNGSYLFWNNQFDPYVNITVTIPSMSQWTAAARIFYDGRTIPAQGIDKGIWTYIGPGPVPTMPSGD